MSNQKWKSLTPREKRQWEGNATTRRALYLNLELWFCQKSSLILRLSLRKRHTVCWKLRSERWKSIDVRGDGRNIGKHLRNRNSDIFLVFWRKINFNIAGPFGGKSTHLGKDVERLNLDNVWKPKSTRLRNLIQRNLSMIIWKIWSMSLYQKLTKENGYPDLWLRCVHVLYCCILQLHWFKMLHWFFSNCWKKMSIRQKEKGWMRQICLLENRCYTKTNLFKNL